LRESVWDSPLCGVDAAGGAYCWDQGPQVAIVPDSVAASSLAYCGATLCLYSPQRVPSAQPLRQYTADLQGPCAVAVSGTVLCSGSNRSNRLGNRSTNFTTDTLVPVLGAPASTFVAASPNGDFACALTTTGKVWCWGKDDYGQVGINVVGSQIATPTQVASTLSFTALAVTLTSACALTTTGQAYCWGDGRQGQIGWNGLGSSPAPYAVSGGRTFTAITAGAGHVCALEAGGAVWCWGDNQLGQLGVALAPAATCGGQLCSAVPVQVQGGLSFRQISAGIGQTCGVTTAGEVYCWGWAAYGRLGPISSSTQLISQSVKIVP
jgi:alpha-tubulin suppressor-like RCC1 family protein